MAKRTSVSFDRLNKYKHIMTGQKDELLYWHLTWYTYKATKDLGKAHLLHLTVCLDKVSEGHMLHETNCTQMTKSQDWL